MIPFTWVCPYCSTHQTVTATKYWSRSQNIDVGTNAWKADVAVFNVAIGCSNPACLKVTVHITVGHTQYSQSAGSSVLKGDAFISRRLIPSSSAKPQPGYIPQALREDYEEACLIQELSPKASATLTRRCLQGMIRDFAKISRARLIEEIKALREAVDQGKAPAGITPESVDAIDHVRSIGNIGAHMEKDIDLIIPVDPGEAQALIELVELLFEEWYIARNVRQRRLARISKISSDKAALKKPVPPANESEPKG